MCVSSGLRNSELPVSTLPSQTMGFERLRESSSRPGDWFRVLGGERGLVDPPLEAQERRRAFPSAALNRQV